MSIYKVSVNNAEPIEVNSDYIKQFNTVETEEGNFHILHNNKGYQAEIISSNFNSKHYKVKINNNIYTVNIEDGLDQLIKDLGFELSSAKHVNDVKAPMPGLILDIAVTVGQEVKEDDTLLILEAMKMENILTSPRDGVIKSIAVEKGATVDKNQLLLEFE